MEQKLCLCKSKGAQIMEGFKNFEEAYGIIESNHRHKNVHNRN